ncbi:hypothetical protein [Wolbachia endosymbiont of Dactylopius coccus]
MFIWLNYHFFSPSSYFLSTEPTSIKKFTKRKKGKRSPGHCLFSVSAFFKS